MNEQKYVGLDVHQSSTVAAVHNERGKRVMESILETQKETIQSFLKGLTGTVHVTFEEGTHAAWLYDVIKPLVRGLRQRESCLLLPSSIIAVSCAPQYSI
jgi:hypothetical protein